MVYIANLADLQGKTVAGNVYSGKAGEQSTVRSIAQAATDLSKNLQLWRGKDGVSATAAAQIKLAFEQFQAVIDKNDDGDTRTEEWTFGKQFTYADITLFEVINQVVAVLGSAHLRSFPKLKEFHDKVAHRPRIDRHLSARPAAQTIKYAQSWWVI